MRYDIFQKKVKKKQKQNKWQKILTLLEVQIFSWTIF